MWVEQPEFEIFNYSDFSFNLSKLAIDEYYIIFNNEVEDTVRMEVLSDECYNCMPLHKRSLFANSEARYTLNAKYSEKWWFYTDKDGLLCDIVPNVGEFGVYEMNISPNNCSLETLVDPVNIYLPILAVILIYLGVAALIVGGIFAYNNKCSKKKEEDAPEVKKQRVRSLDTFRGLSIILMIFINYGGGGYNFLQHAVWNGLTLADLVFPWFLWIMGVCIPISIKSALKRKDPNIFWHILKRSAILFLLGVFLNGISFYFDGEEGFQNIYSLRIFGVLQRFGICYFVVAIVCLAFFKTDFPESPGVFQDIIVMLPQWICAFLCLALNAGLTFGLKIPDCPIVGYLGPGGLQGDDNMSNYGDYVNCTGGAAGYIDRKVLGFELMYRNSEFIPIYQSMHPVDPEGILGTLNAIFQVFIGVQAGMTLLMYKGHTARIARWVIWGAITGLIGGGLCCFAKEGGPIPINKHLWSLSFVLVTSFFAFIILSIFYLIVDSAGFWSGKPFVFAGMNPTILYVGHMLSAMRFPFQWGILNPNLHYQMLAQAFWGTMCWWLVSYWLYKIKFFLSI